MDCPGDPAVRRREQQDAVHRMVPAMGADAVLAVLDALHHAGIPVWVAGGWAVDALLGEQTRLHADLDLAVDATSEQRLLSVLAAAGFVCSSDERPARMVLTDGHGRHIDLHPVVFDAAGHGQQAGFGGVSYAYPPGSFTHGSIGGIEVPCLSAARLVAFHQGYPPTAKDVRDMHLLRDRLGIDLPEPYT